MNNRHFTLVDVNVVAPSSLRLTYADGEQLTVDLANLIARHATLAPLADPAIFITAAVGEWGGSVIFNGDDSLELAADNLRARAVEQAGGYSHELIWNWMARHKLTLEAAAEALGVSRRMLAYYRSGAKPVPRTVALAMLGWEVEQQAA
jgi:hypothetical protein